VSKISLIKIMHLNKLFLLYFIEIWMVSNLGIEMDKEMSKLRPPVNLLRGVLKVLSSETDPAKIRFI
jgi:hypothetical protein